MNRVSGLIAAAMVVITPEMLSGQEDSRPHGEALARVKEYQLSQIDGAKEIPLQFVSQSALNWSNPVFGTTDGAFFLWTLEGRVAAVMKTYKTRNGRWFEQVRTFSSLPLVAREAAEAAPFWTPPSAAEMQRLEDSPKPASTAAARLVQMKALQRSFSASGQLLTGRQQLRPLPHPLYRYPADDDVDGAMFAYVQGTGPDVLLILEARLREDQPQWYYSLGSIGIFEVQVDRGAETVWTEPRRTAQATGATDIYDGRRLEIP